MTVAAQPDAVNNGEGTRSSQRVDEMQQLLAKAESFAVKVRSELEELASLRAAALDEARREAREIVAEAIQESESILERAEQQAGGIVAQAKTSAAEIAVGARREAERLADVVAQYVGVLRQTRAHLNDLPPIPERAATARPDGDGVPIAGEDGSG